MIDVNLIETLAEHYAAKANVPRGDEAFAHISDLYGPCDRATWYRRNGYTPMPFDGDTGESFEHGHQFEADVFASLQRKFGVRNVEQNVTIAWEPASNAWRRLNGGEQPMEGELVGHLDILVWREDGDPEHYVECKSTRGKPELKAHYKEQTIGYCTPLQVDGTVFVRGKFAKGEFPVDVTELNRAWARKRGANLLVTTAPGAEIPPAEPTESCVEFACKYCKYNQCGRNPHSEPTNIIEDLDRSIKHVESGRA